MNYYEELVDSATNNGYVVQELPLKSGDGRCKGRRIAIRQDIPTLKKKADTLAEEIAHGEITVGDISDQSNPNNRRQEHIARLWAYKKRLPLLDIVKAYEAHCQNVFEMSEYLDVSEDTIRDAIECYRQIYGHGTILGDYFIQFEPYFSVGNYIRFWFK